MHVLTVVQKMTKLIDTLEAQSYPKEIRIKIIERAGLRLLFEWRYWVVIASFIILGIVTLKMIKGMNIPWYADLFLSFSEIIIG